MNKVLLPCGQSVPALGLGTWNVGDDRSKRAEEIATLQLGIDLGMTLIDTAEMYGEGKAESLVGEAIQGRREQVFIVSKVYPHNASKRKMRASCTNSLKRLGTDRLDLYLLHWQGSVPLSETLEAFAELKRDGLIRHYGVSNLDLAAMRELAGLPGGREVQTDQVLYNLQRRGIEFDLQPWLRKQHIPVMAYSPIEQGRLARDARLMAFAQKRGMTATQVALAWLLAKDDVIVIPKTSSRARLRENAAALEHVLDAAALAELDKLFAPPMRPVSLEMI